MWMGTKYTRSVSSFGDPSFCAPAFGVVHFTNDAMAADSRGELENVNDFGSLFSSVFDRRRLLPQVLLVRNDRGVPLSSGSECRRAGAGNGPVPLSSARRNRAANQQESLAFKWIRILFRCWKGHKPYSVEVYRQALARRQRCAINTHLCNSSGKITLASAKSLRIPRIPLDASAQMSVNADSRLRLYANGLHAPASPPNGSTHPRVSVAVVS
jgi:hypothetical protein